MNDLIETFNSAQQLSIPLVVFNMIFCLLTSLAVRWVFIHKGMTFGSRLQLSRIIPLLAAVTFLVIIIIKSSLALSLGLVGALSIVRFRSAIKEPEELVFLFLSVAIGLGFAADQGIITIIVVSMILAFIVFAMPNLSRGNELHKLFCNVEWQGNKDGLPILLSAIQSTNNNLTASTLRFSSNNDEHKATIEISLQKNDDSLCINTISKSIRDAGIPLRLELTKPIDHGRIG